MKSPAGIALSIAALLAAASLAAAAEHVSRTDSNDLPSDESGYAPAQRIAHAGRQDVDVWINKDEGGVYRPGESMRVYFRSTSDAYVLVFNVDTEGYIHLIYPYGPEDPPYVDGGRAYRIPARSDPYDLVADGPPGIEYVVAVASPYPFQNLPWYLSADRADGDRPDLDDEDDDTESGQIEGDPYVGIDRIIQRIAPPGREDRIATNETYFYIDRRVEYPRYVCADCHYHPFYFDPYVDACSVFEIRVDATWAHYAPIRFGNVRPRYIYRVRSSAPTRYRQWKQQWSSLDGRATLRTRFLPERDIRWRRERAPQTRTSRPEFRDLRRYREGRIWRGRDEILRLREDRQRVNPDQRDRGQGQGQGRNDQGTPPPDNRARGGRGWWWQGGDRRTPDEQRRPPNVERQRDEQRRRDEQRQRDEQRLRDEQRQRDEQQRQQREEQRNRERDQGNRDRGDRGDKGNRDRGDRGDRGDQGNRDRGDQDRGNRDRGDQGDHGGRGWWKH